MDFEQKYQKDPGMNRVKDIFGQDSLICRTFVQPGLKNTIRDGGAIKSS